VKHVSYIKEGKWTSAYGNKILGQIFEPKMNKNGEWGRLLSE
jgi:hypothetical protein